MWESKWRSVIGAAGSPYPVSAIATSDVPSLIQVASGGSTYESSRCWYSWAKTPS